MKNTQALGEEKIPKLLLRLSVPAIVGMLVNGLYNVVDRIFIGNGVGTLGLAGATIGFPIMIVLMGFGMLIGLGATPLISIKLGEGNKEQAEQVLGNGFVLLIGTSIALSALGLVLLSPLLRLFGASEAVLPYAKDYLGIILWGNVFQAISMGMNGFIRAEGNAGIAMLTMLIGAVMNLILDPIFIFAFGWGIKGAAFATVISQAISASWVLYHYFSGRSSLKLHIKKVKLRSDIVIKILAIGFAPFVLQIANSVLGIVVNNSLIHYGGDIAISAMGIINSILLFVQMPIFGINQGAQPVIGFNYGAKKYDRVRSALRLAIAAATGIALLGFLAIQLFTVGIVSMFNSKDTELIAFSVRAIRICTIFMPLIGFQIISSNYFQAVGKPRYSAALSLSRQVLFLIPLVLILPLFFKLNGIFMAGPVSDLLSSTVTAVFIFRELKRLMLNDSKAKEAVA